MNNIKDCATDDKIRVTAINDGRTLKVVTFIDIHGNIMDIFLLDVSKITNITRRHNGNGVCVHMSDETVYEFRMFAPSSSLDEEWDNKRDEFTDLALKSFNYALGETKNEE